MGDPPGQQAQRLHFLGSLQLRLKFLLFFFCFLALGNIASDTHDTGRIAIISKDERHRHFRRKCGAVLTEKIKLYHHRHVVISRFFTLGEVIHQKIGHHFHR